MSAKRKIIPRAAVEEFRHIHDLFSQGKYSSARPLIRELLRKFPADPLVTEMLAISYSEANQPQRAVKILQSYLKRFGDHYEVLYMLAETYIQLRMYEVAETTYRRSLVGTPKNLAKERSDCYNGLGVALWEQHKRGDALAAWEQAVSTDPTNKIARRNLEEFINAYNEAKAPSPVFDDVYHFQKIHIDRYFASTGKQQFASIKEGNRVVGAIMQAWNEQIAPLRDTLDRMTAAEKTMRFTEVTIDFGALRRKPTPPTPLPLHASPRANPDGVLLDDGNETSVRALAILDNMVPFLPQGGGLTLLFGIPVLAAAGFPEGRLKSIVKGAKVTEQEKRIFAWSNDVLHAVVSSLDEQGNLGGPQKLQEAIAVARRVLSPELAVLAVNEMVHLLMIGPDALFPQKKKRGRKK